jgi:sugar/nucleoside kinase (ribokinase family)
MSLLVVGTVAFDSIETPHGSVERILGGSAMFSSMAASFFTKPRLVGVVGEDFPDFHREAMQERGIDLAGLQTEKGGKTFYWKGRYHENMNSRETMEVHLNVLATFDPVLPASFRDSTHIFLANSSPAVQLKVLDQVHKPQLVLADTMDFWITSTHDDLMKLLPRVDGLLLNDSEASLLTGETHMMKAGRKIQDMGPKFVIVKRGEHGAMLISGDGVFVIPAWPTEPVVDPTGAGDSFAGGVLGHLIAHPEGPKHGRLRRAMVYGTVIASMCVEDFGPNRLRKTDRKEIDERVQKYRAMLDF